MPRATTTVDRNGERRDCRAAPFISVPPSIPAPVERRLAVRYELRVYDTRGRPARIAWSEI
jgi:hypothetical protein